MQSTFYIDRLMISAIRWEDNIKKKKKKQIHCHKVTGVDWLDWIQKSLIKKNLLCIKNQTCWCINAWYKPAIRNALLHIIKTFGEYPLLGGILLQDICRSKNKVHVLKLTHDCCILTVLLANHLLLRTCSARATMSQTGEMLGFSKRNQSIALKRVYHFSSLSFFGQF